MERFPRRGEVLHARGSFKRAAGGGGVAAKVLAEHGADVSFFCALGQDEDGEAAAAQLREHGLDLHVAWRLAPTRRVVTLLEPGGERTIITIGSRLQPEGGDELPWPQLADCAGVYFTAGDGDALRAARQATALVATPRAGIALSDPETPVDALVFSAEDPDEAGPAREWGGGARWQIATEGARGGSWWGASAGRWSALPAPGEPQDSYGCGDSFAAGVTLALADGRSIEAAVQTGAEWGAMALTRTGAP